MKKLSIIIIILIFSIISFLIHYKKLIESKLFQEFTISNKPFKKHIWKILQYASFLDPELNLLKNLDQIFPTVKFQRSNDWQTAINLHPHVEKLLNVYSTKSIKKIESI